MKKGRRTSRAQRIYKRIVILFLILALLLPIMMWRSVKAEESISKWPDTIGKVEEAEIITSRSETIQGSETNLLLISDNVMV